MKQTTTGLSLFKTLSAYWVFISAFLFFNSTQSKASCSEFNNRTESLSGLNRLEKSFNRDVISNGTSLSEPVRNVKKLVVATCQDSLITRLPARVICAGEEFEVGVEFQSKSDVLWFTLPSGGTPFDTTRFGEKTKLVLNASAVYYLQSTSIDSACSISRVPISLLVNTRPSLAAVEGSVSICQDSLIALSTVLLNAPDDLNSSFAFYADSLKQNRIDSLVGAGKYFVFQESIHGCSSVGKAFSVVEKVCDAETIVDLSLVKSANKRTVTIDEEIEYTITVKNATLNHNATNVYVEDALPEGLSFVSSSDFLNSGDTLTLKIDTVFANTSKAFRYKAKANKLGNIVNFAEIIKVDQPDPNSTPGNGIDKNEDDDDDEAILVIAKDTTEQTADLSLTKLVNKVAVNKGENVIYTLTLTNAGPHVATNVVVSDTLSRGLTYVKTTGGETVVAAGRTITVKFDSLSVNSTKQFLIEARVDSVGQIVNRAEVVSSDQKDPDSTPGSGANEDDDDSVAITVLEECGSLSAPLISTARNYVCSGEAITLMAVGCANVVWSTGQTGASIQVNPQVNTTYTAACYSGSCKGRPSNSLLVSIVSNAKPTITASTKSICFGEEVILTLTGCSEQVLWSNGENGKTISVWPDKTTKYTAKCEGGSCAGNISNEVEIVVNSTSNEGVTTHNFIKNVCPSDFVNLNSAIITKPAQATIVFKNGVLPSSSDADSLIYGKGLFYAFARYSNGCLSKPSPITVDIEICEADTSDLSIDLVVNKTDAFVGDTISVTTILSNPGPGTVAESVIRNSVFSGLSLIGNVPGLTVVGNELDWESSDLGVNQKDSLKYNLRALESGYYNYKSRIQSSSVFDPNLSNNEVFKVLKVRSQGPCLASALRADTLKLNDSTYQLTLSTYLFNCGNQSLSSVNASLNLSDLFSEPLTYSLQSGPALNSGSSLISNEGYNGKTNFSLLKEGSSLDPGDVDTVTVRYRIQPNGASEEFFLNAIASGEYGAGDMLSDTSNNGETIIKNLSTPTSVSFGSKYDLASILNVRDIAVIQPGVNKITFQAVFKNKGESVVSSIVVSDSLSKYFASPAKFSVSELKSLRNNLLVNPDFNGSSDSRLTLATSSLPSGAIDTLEFSVTLSDTDTTVYYNQLVTSAVTGSDTLSVLSHWTSNINETGSLPTRFEVESNELEDYCMGLGLAAVEKVWQSDGSINITYKATIGNCGRKQLRNVSLCDNITDGLSDSAVVTLVSKPTVNSGSHLILNPDFDGTTESCILMSALSYLDSAAVDTVTYTLNVKPHGLLYTKSLTLISVSDSSDTLRVVSNDGMNPFIFGQIPTIVNLDQEYDSNKIGLAKKLLSITDLGEDKFEVEFRFTVKNYSDTIISDLQIQDDLNQAFGDSVSIESVSFSGVPANWVVNSEFNGVGDNINLLVDSMSSIDAFSTQRVNLKVRLQLKSKNTLVFENFGLVIGKSMNSVISLEDISTDGDNPDGNLTGSPKDDSLVTVIDFRSFYNSGEVVPLGVAKSGLAELTSTGGTRISYTVVVKNYGTEELQGVNLLDDLKRVFDRNTQYVLLTGPDVNEGATLKPNKSYNGTTDVDLLAEGSTLEAGKADTLYFSVGVFNTNDDSQTYRNQIIGTAIYSGEEIMDLSVSGLNPDVDGDGNPGNDSGYTINLVDPGVIDSTEVRVVISEGISPNGDGLNDEWIIRDENGSVSVNRMGILKVEIFNRWGHPVYKSEDYGKDLSEGNGWKGNANVGVIIGKGSTLPDGTYFYSVSSSEAWVFGGRRKVGFVTLKR